MLKLSVYLYARSQCLYIKRYLGVRFFHKHLKQQFPIVSVSRLKQLFKQRYLSIVEGHACIIADCPICNTKKNGPRIYINKTTGYFVCDKCRYTGTWDILQHFLVVNNGNVSKEKAKDLESIKANLELEQNFSKEWEDLRNNCQDVSTLSKETYKTLLDTFSLPNVSQKDMQQLRCMMHSDTLYFPVIGLGDSLVGYKSISTNPELETTVPPYDISGCVIYNEPNVKSDGTGVVVETIHDLLALVSQKVANTIICLPYNLQCLPQNILPSLEKYKKLILWFGNDETSWYMVKHFAKKLGEKRCCFVRPTDTQPRPKLALAMGYELKRILKNAQSISHQSITTFQQLREDVLDDLQNIEKEQGIKWKRYPALNRILKGHRRGEFTVLTGPTGSGKTTFMSEYSLDLAMQGINTLWGSFEIKNSKLARTMLQQMAGVDISKHLENFDLYADMFEKLPIYFMTFHGEQSIKIVMDAIEHAAYVHDITHVVIDNVQFMLGSDIHQGDRFYKQDNVIGKFRNFATKYNCHVTAIIHPRKEREDEDLTISSIFGSAKASQEADNVLIIQDKRLTSIRGKKFLQIAKNRYSGDLGVMMLDFDKEGLSYAQKKKSKEDTEEEEEEPEKRRWSAQSRERHT